MNQMQPLTDAFHRLAERAVAFLPHVLSAVILLAFGWLVSRLLAGGTRRLARRLGLDAALERAGWAEALARANVRTPPSEITARLVFWIVFVIFLVLAAENLELGLTAVPLRAFIEYLPRILGAVLLLFVGSAVAGILGSAVAASLAKIDFAQHKLLGSLVRVLILLFTVMMAIEHLGFDVTFLTTTVTNLVTIFAAGIAVTFALGGREVARNMLAGYYARERFRAGDVLALPEGEGRLEGIGTLNSVISLEEGSLVVPNSRLVDTCGRRVEK